MSLILSGGISIDIIEDQSSVSVLGWIRNELQGINKPANLPFDCAALTYEQLTLVECRFLGTEQIEDMVHFTFASPNQITYPMVLFWAPFRKSVAVFGCLRSSAFHQLLESNIVLTFEDIGRCELDVFFQGLSQFALPPYFHLPVVPVNPADPNLDYRRAVETTLSSFQTKTPLQEWNATQPMAFRWLVFAASATDPLTEDLLQYELQAFVSRLRTFADNPLLAFHYVRRWLCVDWHLQALQFYRHSHAEPPPASYARLHQYARYHNTLAFAAPSHTYSVRGHKMPHYLPFTTCRQCSTRTCPRPLNENGIVQLPITSVFDDAVHRLENFMRGLVFDMRRTRHTQQAFLLWPHMSFFEPTKSVWPQIRRLLPEGMPSYGLENSGPELENFSLFHELDYVMLHSTVLPMWRTKPPVAKKSFGSTQPQRTVHAIIDSHAALLEHAERCWPPCMVALVRLCNGAIHIKNNTRMKLALFILNTGADAETARQMWLHTFTETDRFRVQCGSDEDAFWRNDIGVTFAYMQGEPRYNQPGKHVGCGVCIRDGICAMNTTDIEEAGNMCRTVLNIKLHKAGRKPVAGKFTVRFPHVFPNMLN